LIIERAVFALLGLSFLRQALVEFVLAKRKAQDIRKRAEVRALTIGGVLSTLVFSSSFAIALDPSFSNYLPGVTMFALLLHIANKAIYRRRFGEPNS
jgi:hypothetical protein